MAMLYLTNLALDNLSMNTSRPSENTFHEINYLAIFLNFSQNFLYLLIFYCTEKMI